MNPKIIVIGAGASGIAAATRLIDHGFNNLVVLEAENRMGGRINTIPFASNVVDLGAQWCHGEKDNVVFEMGKNFNLFESEKVKYNRTRFFTSQGAVIPAEIGDRLMVGIISILEDTLDELKNYKGSLGQFVIDKFTKMMATPEYSDIDPKLANQFLDFYAKYESSIEAADNWFDCSAIGYTEYHDCEGDRLLNWKDKGYQTVFDLLTRKLSNGMKPIIKIEEYLEFGKEVTSIKWSDNPDNIVTVRCSDGSTYDADHVISTMSLGVLKERYLDIFNPPLPVNKVRAIQGLTIGTVDKMYLEFKERFWPENWLGFSLLWEDDDIEEIKQMRNEWMLDVFGFYTVACQPTVLCGWISGESARRMERTPEEEVKKCLTFLLKKFVKTMAVSEPINIKRTTWFSNTHFRGSYTFQSMNTMRLNTGPSDLARPLTNSLGVPSLMFAGEATHDHYFSTVHGAIESGFREAERIAQFYGREYDLDQSRRRLNSINLNGEDVRNGQSNAHIYDVVIVGAGLAGLGAALTLTETGDYSFVILEAQKQPGGRIQTVPMEDYLLDSNFGAREETVIDAGAQWLHGKYNRLYELASDHNLLADYTSEEGLGPYISESGEKIDEYLVKKIDFKFGQILEQCERLSQSKHVIEYPKSVEHFVLKKFEKYLSEHVKDPKIKQQAWDLLNWHFRFLIIDNSCLTADQMSAQSWGKYSFNGEICQAHINFKNGFSSVVNVLVDMIDADKILYKKVVKNVSVIGPDSCEDLNEDYLCVRCADGSLYLAKNVIMTISLAVLKENINELISFPMPDTVKQTIHDLGCGTINKIFLTFEEAWWGDMQGIQLVWDNFDLHQVQEWTKFISGFDVLLPKSRNTLIGWVGGHGAMAMEAMSDKEIIQDCIKILKKFTKLDVPLPIKYYCTRWNSNPFIRCTYSYTSTACDKNKTSNSVLAEPIIVGEASNSRFTNRYLYGNGLNDYNTRETDTNEPPALLFAGEACHDKYFSTAHGAFLSGVEQATKVINFDEMN